MRRHIYSPFIYISRVRMYKTTNTDTLLLLWQTRRLFVCVCVCVCMESGGERVHAGEELENCSGDGEHGLDGSLCKHIVFPIMSIYLYMTPMCGMHHAHHFFHM